MDWLSQAFDPVSIGAFLSQFQQDAQTPAFWLAVGKIIWINVLLSGDNALVIAMACRSLQPQQRVWGMVLGSAIAVALRMVFTAIVATLMNLPYLKLVGGLALLAIAVKLLVPDDEGDDVAAARNIWQAVRIVAIADIVMSLDNVIAVAAAADGQITLLVLGLIVSIPMIVAGAALIMMLLDRFPLLIWLGAILLGWIAGDVIATDPGVHPWLEQVLSGKIVLTLDAASKAFNAAPRLVLEGDLMESLLSAAGALAVLIVGGIWRRSRLHRNSLKTTTDAERTGHIA